MYYSLLFLVPPAGWRPFCSLLLVICQAGNFSSFFFPFFVLCCFSRRGFSLLGAWEWTCAQDYNDSMSWTPFPAMWSSWSLCRVPPKSFLVDSSASTMHAYFDLRVSDSPQVCPANARRATGLLYSRPLVLQGIAAGIGTSNFLRAFSKSFLGFLTCWVNEVNTSQCSCIVKLRFFDSPLLLLFSYWRFWHVFPYLWPQGGWPGCRLLPCQSPPEPCTSVPRFFVQYLEPSEAFPRIWQVSVPTNVPINRRCFSPALHPVTFL